MARKVEVVLHEESCFPDSVLGFIKTYVIDLPVGFNVLFKDEIVFDATVLIVLQPVDEKVRDDSIPFIFREVLCSHNEIDVIGLLSEVSSGGIEYPEVESQIKATIYIPAEDRVKEDLFFRSLYIFEDRYRL